jgi:hypothetical protein
VRKYHSVAVGEEFSKELAGSTGVAIKVPRTRISVCNLEVSFSPS